MGNSSSELYQKILTFSDLELQKFLHEDEILLTPIPAPLSSILESQKQSNPNLIFENPSSSETLNSSIEDLKLCFSSKKSSKLKEKYESLLHSLQLDQNSLLCSLPDPSFEVPLKLISYSLSKQKSLLQSEERLRRKLESLKIKSSTNQDSIPSEPLPAVTEAGVNFCIRSVVDMIDLLSGVDASISLKVLKNLNQILSELPLNSLTSSKNFSSNLRKLDDFLLNLELKTPSSALLSLFSLSLSSGNLGRTLWIALKLYETRFLTQSDAKNFKETCKKLKNFEGKSFGKRVWMTWSHHRSAGDVISTNQSLTAGRNENSGWGSMVTEQSLKTGFHYFEMKIDRRSNSSSLVGLAGRTFASFNKKACISQCFTLHADGDVFINEANAGKAFKFVEGDRVGLFVDMEAKCLTFYLNGVKQIKPPFYPLPDEVVLIACFGTSGHLVTIVNDPQLPDDLKLTLGPLAKLFEKPFVEKKDDVIEKKENFGNFDDFFGFPFFAERILEHKVLNKDYLNEKEISVVVLASLDRIVSHYFRIFDLQSMKKEVKTCLDIPCFEPLAVEISENVMKTLLEILERVFKDISQLNWQDIDSSLTIWTCLSTLRILKAHFFVIDYLKIDGITFGMTPEQGSCYCVLLEQLINIDLHDFPAQDAEKALNEIKKEASLAFYYGFDLFYASTSSKLQFLLTRLHLFSEEAKQQDVYKSITLDLLHPVNFSVICTEVSPDFEENFSLISEKILEIIKNFLETKEIPKNSEIFLIALNSIHSTLLSKSSRNDFKGLWKSILMRYSLKLLNVLKGVFESTPENFSRIAKSSVFSCFIVFFYNLAFAKPDLTEISAILEGTASVIKLMNRDGFRDYKGECWNFEDFNTIHPFSGQVPEKGIKTQGQSKFELEFNQLSSTATEKNLLKIWKFTDKKVLVGSYCLNGFPQKVTFEGSQMLFEYCPEDPEKESWGWEIRIKYVSIDLESQSNFKNLLLSLSFLSIFYLKTLVSLDFSSESSEISKFLSNPMIRFTFPSKINSISKKIFEIEDLLKLSELSFSPSGPVQFNDISSEASQARLSEISFTKTSDSIQDFIESFTQVTLPDLDNSLFSKWTSEDDAVKETWAWLKELSITPGPNFSIGGSDLDNLEKAVFFTFSVIFGFSELLKNLKNRPELPSSFKLLVKQACNIRVWAQHFKQTLIDEGNEKTYSEISEEVLKKSMFFIAAGKIDLETQDFWSFREKIRNFLGRTEKEEERSGDRKIDLAKALERVGKSVQSVGFGGDDQKNDLNVVKIVYKCLIDFYSSKISAEVILSSVNSRRKLAVARVIGIELFHKMLSTFSASRDEISNWTMRFFSESFKSQPGKKHYLCSLEGIELNLQKLLRLSLFSLQKHLFSILSSTQPLTLSRSQLFFYLSILDSLVFPIKAEDISSLSSFNLHEYLSFLISTARGQALLFQPTGKKDLSKIITGLEVLTEYPGPGFETVCLTSDQSGCESLDFFESKKLWLKIERNEKNELLDPISEIFTGNECPDGFEPVQGSIAESGEDLFIFVKRTPLIPGKKFLTGLKVLEEKPVVFKCFFVTFEEILVKENYENEEDDKLLGLLIRKMAWVLFKFLSYSIIENSLNSSISNEKAQKILVNVLLDSVKSFEFKTLQQELNTEENSPSLFEICSGEKWIRETFKGILISQNPMKLWIHEFKRLFIKQDEDQLLYELIQEFIIDLDPCMSGVVETEIIEGFEDWTNSEGKIDFFVFLNSTIKKNYADLCPDLLSHPFMKILPKDMQEAQFLLSEDPETLTKVLLKYGNFSSSQSFSLYLNLLLQQESQVFKGRIPPVFLPEGTPQNFLNDSGEFDLIKSISSILDDPSKFPVFYSELEPFTIFLRQIKLFNDASCNNEKTLSSIQYFSESILWILMQSLPAPCMKKILSQEIELFIKLSLLSPGFLSQFSFKVLSEVLPSHHSPHSLKSIWQRLDFFELKFTFLDPFDWIRTFFLIIGFAGLWVARTDYSWFSNFGCDVKLINRLNKLCSESCLLLGSLCSSPRWKTFIISSLCSSLIDPDSLQVMIGGLRFLSRCLGTNDLLDCWVFEWTKIKQSGSVPAGVVISSDNEKDFATLYNEETDSFLEIGIEKLENIEPAFCLDLSSLDPTLKEKIVNKLIQLVKSQELRKWIENSGFSYVSIVENICCSLIFRVISGIFQDLSDFKRIEHEIVMFLVKKLKSIKSKAVKESGIRIQELLKVLSSRLVERISSENEEFNEKAEIQGKIRSFQISAADEARLISGMNENLQITVATLQSLNFTFSDIYSAIQLGITGTEEIMTFLASQEDKLKNSFEIQEEKDKSLIYKLQKTHSKFSIKDPSCLGHFEISPSGQMSIQTSHSLKSPLFLYNTLSSLVTHSFSSSKNLEIFIKVSLLENLLSGLFFFIFGKLKIRIDSRFDDCSLYANGDYIGSVEKRKDFLFKISLEGQSFDDLFIQLRDSLVFFNLTDSSVFNGLSFGRFGIGLAEGAGIVLNDLEIRVLNEKIDVDEWLSTAEPFIPSIIERSSFKIENKAEVTEASKARLKLLAVSEEDLRTVSSFHDFQTVLKATLPKIPSFLADEARGNYFPVIDVQLFDTLEEVPEGFTVVRTVFKDQKLFPLVNSGENFTKLLPGQRVLCIKQGKTSSTSEKYVVGLSLVDNFANSSGVDLGSLFKESEKTCKVWVNKISRSKLAGILPLSDVFILEVENGLRPQLPLGYEIVEVDGKLVNLAPGAGFFYLCFSRLAFIFNMPLVPLVFSKRSVPDKGMTSEMRKPPLAGRSKKLAKAVKDYPRLSTLELLSQVQAIHYSNKHLSMILLLKKIVKASPDVFSSVFLNSSRVFRKFFKIFAEDLEFLRVSIEKVLLQDSKQEKSRIFFMFVEMMTCLSFQPIQDPGLDEQLVDLKLQNDEKNDEEIAIPGADGLRVEFLEVRIEKSSDLYFYRHKNRIGLLQKSIKGKINDFQVPGERLFMHFESSSSSQKVLKFRVVPLRFPGLPKLMLPDHTSVLQSRWLLKCLLKHSSELFEFLSLPHFQAGVFSFFHNTSDEELRLDLLQLLEKSLSLRTSSFSLSLNSFLHHELCQIRQADKRNSQITTLQQKLISFSCASFNDSLVKPEAINEKWLLETHNFYKFMHGMVHKSRFQDAQKVILFLNIKKIPLVKVRESFHPYSKKSLKQLVKIEGAALLEIKIDPRCELDVEDSMLFSYDLEGEKRIEAKKSIENQEAFWSSKFKWTDVVFSNNNLSITRTNSSGWGSALWSEVYSKGKIKLSFKIDNDGKSDYLYIGILKADGNYKLNEVVNSDNSHELWTWKITGEFHRKGSRQSIPEGKYRTGDIVSLLLNFTDLSMTCLKNGIEVFKFLPISKEVIPIISFGGSNQHVTALPVENLRNDQENLICKKLLVQGDSFFFHFPVSSGLFSPKLFWKHNFEKTVFFSSDLKIAKSLPGLDEKGLVLNIGGTFKAGKHFCQIAARTSNESTVAFALIAENSENEEKNEKNALVWFESNGKLLIQGNEYEIKSFGNMEKVSIFFDYDAGDVGLFKDHQQLVFTKVKVDVSSYSFAFKFKSPGQLGKIITNPEVPPSLKAFLTSSLWTSGSQGSSWGYKFSVIPHFWGSSVTQLIETLSSSYREDYLKFSETYKTSVPRQVEEFLVEFIDEHCQKSKTDPLLFSFLKPGLKEDLQNFPSLSSIPSEILESHLNSLQKFNKSLEKYLPLISLTLSDLSEESFSKKIEDSLQRLVFSSGPYIFNSVKSTFFSSSLTSSASEGKLEVSIDRTKALKLKTSGKSDSQGMVSVFGQVFRSLSQVSSSLLRSNERSFKVLFRGEGAVDLGGPYNETLSCMCDELMSRTLNLFIPTPNHVHNTGENRESWTINPSATSKLALDMFEFFGKFIGFAIRTNINLSLTLPPIFWKRLLMQKTCLNDLKAVDECCWQMIKDLKNMKNMKNGSEELGKIEHLFFEVHDSSGKLVELQENGRILKVELENLNKFVKLLKRLRLEEAELQFRRIRKGLSAILPFDMLCLFTGKQVEDMVCGTADFDVDVLRAVTEYQGFDAEGPVIKGFWQVLKEMTAKDKSLFLRFVSGRSRLPLNQEYRKFKIFLLKKSGNPDHYLPVAHTCFFQIDLPQYSSKEILKEKMFYAIRHCRIIDLDAIAGGGWAD